MFKRLMRSVLRSKIFAAGATGVIVGIILSVIFRISFFSSFLWLLMGFGVFFVAFLKPSLLVVGVAFLAGTVIGSFRVAPEMIDRNIFEAKVGEVVEIAGEVFGDPEAENGSAKLKLKKLKLDGENIRGVIYFSGETEGLSQEIERGDKIIVSGELSDSFGGYAGTIFSGKIKKHEKPEPGSLVLKTRNKFYSKVLEIFGENEREAKLGLAYLLGMKNGIDDELIEVLSLVGLTHIVVASGTHLGIVVGFLKKYGVKISRFAGFLFSAVFVLGFGQMIGWTASITRAALVCGIALVAWYVGYEIRPIKIILVAVMTTLLINPLNIVDLGWLLSFASFFGIMVLMPEMIEFFYGKVVWGKWVDGVKPSKLSEMIIATVGATMMCAPILLYFFGSLSLISLLANILILPTMAGAMGLVFLSGVVGFLPGWMGWLKFIVVKITTILIDYHIVVMEFFAQRKEFIMTVEAGNPGVFWLYLVFLGPFVVNKIMKERARRERMKDFEAHFEERIRWTIDKKAPRMAGRKA